MRKLNSIGYPLNYQVVSDSGKLSGYRQQEFESRRGRDMDRYQSGGALGGDRMSGMIGGGEMDNRRRMEMEQRRNADLFASVSIDSIQCNYLILM